MFPRLSSFESVNKEVKPPSINEEVKGKSFCVSKLKPSKIKFKFNLDLCQETFSYFNTKTHFQVIRKTIKDKLLVKLNNKDAEEGK